MNEEEKKVFLLLSLLQEIENSPSDFNPGEEEEEDENHVQRECDRIIRSLKNGLNGFWRENLHTSRHQERQICFKPSRMFG